IKCSRRQRRPRAGAISPTRCAQRRATSRASERRKKRSRPSSSPSRRRPIGFADRHPHLHEPQESGREVISAIPELPTLADTTKNLYDCHYNKLFVALGGPYCH
ncbi:hypothetical protein BJV78DRAFT_1247438, partial [Lactifluus subvellereus]